MINSIADFENRINPKRQQAVIASNVRSSGEAKSKLNRRIPLPHFYLHFARRPQSASRRTEIRRAFDSVLTRFAAEGFSCRHGGNDELCALAPVSQWAHF